MSEYHRELPAGGSVSIEVETDDELVRDMLVSSMDIAINAIRNVEQNTPGRIESNHGGNQ